MTFTKNSNNGIDHFWTILEFKLSHCLQQSDNPELKGFWCDGIHLPSTDHQLHKKFINDNRKIHLTAWLGKTGQEKYSATIHFGRKAQSLYARELPLESSIPDCEMDWFEVDVSKKCIDIYLN